MMETGIDNVEVKEEYLIGKVLAANVIDPDTKEVLIKCNEIVTEDMLRMLQEKQISSIKLIQLDEEGTNAYIRNTMLSDRVETRGDAIIDIYRRLRPSNPPRPEPRAMIRLTSR